VLSFLEQIGLTLAHHPVQARVVPHLRRLHPAGVVHLTNIERIVTMMVEQRLAGMRDTQDVRDGAVS
jgi:hypothetical protein